MSITLTDELTTLLEAEAQRAGLPVDAIAERMIRSALALTEPTAPKPFQVKPFDMVLPPEWTSGKVQDLLDILDGPNAR